MGCRDPCKQEPSEARDEVGERLSYHDRRLDRVPNPLLLLVYSQVILSVMIPLPMIPLILYTSRRGVMGEYKMTIVLGILCVSPSSS